MPPDVSANADLVPKQSLVDKVYVRHSMISDPHIVKVSLALTSTFVRLPAGCTPSSLRE